MLRWLKKNRCTCSVAPEKATRRRSLLRKGMAALALALVGKQSEAAAAETMSTATNPASGLCTEGEPLRTNVYQGRPPMEPLDTKIRFERSDNHNGKAITHEILSLMHEEKGKRSFPWTIYSHLTTHHAEGDACVHCSRLHKKDAGWSSGLHSEVFTSGRGVAIGVNVEMSNEYTGPDEQMVIGMHLQPKGPKDCQYGIEMHDGGGRFEKGVGLNGTGQVGMDIAGEYDVGIHAHTNSIRLSEGARLELDDRGQVCMRYRAGRIEFLNGERCIGHIRIEGNDHEL